MSLVEITDRERRIADRVDNQIMNALAVSDTAGGVQFANAVQVQEFAKTMALAHVGVRKHLRGNPGACLAICVQAIEWGMSPFAVANKSYAVNDQIAFESQLIQAVVLKRAPIKGRLKVEYSGVGEKRVCRVWARLRDDPEEIVEYTSPEFGRITPKNSPLWKSDPDQQQFYYSGRALCRRHFPDVLLGVYAEDELDRAPRLGPDKARDVTPSRTLSDRLAALAEARNAEGDPTDSVPDRDISDDTPAGAGDRDPPPAPADAAGSRPQQDAGAAASPAPASEDDDVFPGDRPSKLDPIEMARERGAQGYRDGMQRRAVPLEYRQKGREAEAKAWADGYAAARQADEAGGDAR